MTEYTRHPAQHETVDIKLVDGVFVKSTTFPVAGMVVPQHAHTYDHISICAAGAARVEADGVSLGVVRAGDAIKIAARVKHLFTTLEPGTVIMCVHNADRAEDVAVHEEHHLSFTGDA